MSNATRGITIVATACVLGGLAGSLLAAATNGDVAEPPPTTMDPTTSALPPTTMESTTSSTSSSSDTSVSGSSATSASPSAPPSPTDLAQLRDALERDLAAALQSNPISFSPGEEWIPDDAAYVLRELAQLIVDSGLDAIEVRAHTSSLTDVPLNNDANLVLSQRRADAVRAELVRLGVAPGAISATGVGEAEPIDDNTTQAGRDKNRRVEIRVNDTP